MTEEYGPKTKLAQETHKKKYRGKGESFKECCNRQAAALTESEEEYYSFREVLLNQRFLPGGRIQSSVGSPKSTTAFNCFLSNTIEDSMSGIMDELKNAAETMRMGGGEGFPFYTIRPAGSRIKTLGSLSSGVLPFINIYDAMIGSVKSAGHRRGAGMAVLLISHPDIEEFILAKNNTEQFKNFNFSIAVTGEFMLAVANDDYFDLTFNGVVYDTVRAKHLWDKVMRSTWDWGEPK